MRSVVVSIAVHAVLGTIVVIKVTTRSRVADVAAEPRPTEIELYVEPPIAQHAHEVDAMRTPASHAPSHARSARVTTNASSSTRPRSCARVSPTSRAYQPTNAPPRSARSTSSATTHLPARSRAPRLSTTSALGALRSIFGRADSGATLHTSATIRAFGIAAARASTAVVDGHVKTRPSSHRSDRPDRRASTPWWSRRRPRGSSLADR